MANWYETVRTYGNSLTHHGIKGQKWGVRRFQYENGSYTSEGKQRYYGSEYDKGIKKGKYTNDPEVRELYIMEQMELDARDKKFLGGYRNQITAASTALTKKDKAMLEKVKNGEEFTDKDLEVFRKLHSNHFDINASAYKHYADLLKKNNARSYEDLSEDAKKKADEIAEQMTQHRNAMNELDYAGTLAREQKYAKEIRNETNPILIDPSYRNFKSKEEKAKAETDYLGLWTMDPDTISDDQYDRYTREWLHMQNRVTGLSMNGYEGTPKSDRNKSLFVHNDDPSSRYNEFDNYENWTPKYEKSKEWLSLQNKKKQIQQEVGLDKARRDWYNVPSNNLKEYKKLSEAFKKAEHDYSEKTRDISAEEKKIVNAFNEQICKNTLKDLGYELTPENIEAIQWLIWSD